MVLMSVKQFNWRGGLAGVTGGVLLLVEPSNRMACCLGLRGGESKTSGRLICFGNMAMD